ncbi:MAG: SIMPL domain-containing protein [Nitrospirota bacterium]|nr:SIMPL domain-containing protein [Nitrospirota bacterium]
MTWTTKHHRTALALGLMLLVAPGTAPAHDDAKPAVPTLTVTGTGTLALAPDMALVTFGMQTSGKSLSEAQRQNSSVMQRVIDRLGELQIDKTRIQTSSFSVTPQYKPPPKRHSDSPSRSPEIIGYRVSHSVTVELFDPEKVGDVIEQTLVAGANHFQAVQWVLKDEQQARLEALKQAVVKAREKASTLGESLKVKLVRLIRVDEGEQAVRPLSHASRSMMSMNTGGSEPPILGGEIKVEASVTLVYEIAQNDAVPTL